MGRPVILLPVQSPCRGPEKPKRNNLNRKAGAIIGAVIAVIIVGGVTVAGISAGAPDEATAPEAPVPSSLPTVPPTASPIAVATPSPTPIPTATPAPIPTAIPMPVPTTVPLPKLTAKVAGATKIKYFKVRGESPAAILADVVLRSKSSCKAADTLACVSLRWGTRWTNVTRFATGACTIVAPA